MKNAALLAIFLASLTTAALAGPSEKILLVKQTDRKKQETYSLMSSEEYKEVEQEIKAEARLHMKAMMATEKEWRKDESLARKSFPRSAIAVRTIRVITTYRDDEQANKKLAYYMEKDAKAAEKRAERDRHRGRGRRGHGRDNDREARKEARAAEKEALEEQARQLYENKLSELLQGTANKEAEPPAPAAAGARAGGH